MKPTTRRQTAKHEAAHALAAWLTGCRLNFLTLDGPAIRDGCAAYSSQKFPSSNRDLMIDDVTARLAVYLAPATTGPLDFGALNDIFELMKILTWGTAEGAEMAHTAADLLDKHPDDWQAAAAEFFERFRDQAAVVNTDPAREIIDSLAGHLAAKGSLSGFEVARFIEKHWAGDPPTKALPASSHLPALDTKHMTPQERISEARRLVKMAFEVVSCCDETESAAEKTLNLLFQLLEN